MGWPDGISILAGWAGSPPVVVRRCFLLAELGGVGIVVVFQRDQVVADAAIKNHDRSRGFFNLVRPERFELPTAWFVARYSIQLSYGRRFTLERVIQVGAPGEIRTPDRLVRSQVLYPAELRARWQLEFCN